MRVRLLFFCLLLVGALFGCTTQRIESPGASQTAAKQLYVGLHTKDWEVRVKIEPLLPGDRPVVLTLLAHTGEIPAGTLLALEFSRTDAAGAPQRFEAKPLSGGEYRIDAVPLTAGQWQLRAIVTPPGVAAQAVGYTFEVPVK